MYRLDLALKESYQLGFRRGARFGAPDPPARSSTGGEVSGGRNRTEVYARSNSFGKICASLFSENIYKSQTQRFYSRIASVKGNAAARPLLLKVTPFRPRIRRQ